MIDSTEAPSDSDAQAADQALTFQLAGVTYALPVQSVREIRGFDGVTPVPGSPDHVIGVMNLRGQLVPVADLCALFRVSPRTDREMAVVILVEMGARTVGALVDAVSDVVHLSGNDSSCLDAMGATIERRFLSGMTTTQDAIVLRLDVGAVFGATSTQDLPSVRAASA